MISFCIKFLFQHLNLFVSLVQSWAGLPFLGLESLNKEAVLLVRELQRFNLLYLITLLGLQLLYLLDKRLSVVGFLTELALAEHSPIFEDLALAFTSLWLTLQLAQQSKYGDWFLIVLFELLALLNEVHDPQALHLLLDRAPEYLNVIPLLLIGKGLAPESLLEAGLLWFNSRALGS
jgi:hypothetical protein